MEEILIRRMTEDDAPYLSAIDQKTFSMPWKTEDFLEMIAKESVAYYVAKIDGEIVGGAGVRNILGDGEITNVVVDENFRRRGIARRLLTELMDEGRRLGVTAFTLEVRAGNAPAINLYESLGFAGVGYRKNFYERPTEDALIMWTERLLFTADI